MLIVGLILIASCSSTTAPTVAEGVMDREFGVGGGTTTLSKLHATDSRPIVFNLWATWCAPCLEEMPDLEAAHQVHGDRILFVGVNISDSPTRSAEQADALGITYLRGRDPEGGFTTALGAVGLPVTGFVNRSGGLAHVHHGPIDPDGLEAAIAEHLS